MEEKTLLAEIEKEQKKKIEERFLEQKEKSVENVKNIEKQDTQTEIASKNQTKKSERKSLNPFSSKFLQNNKIAEKLDKKHAQLNGKIIEEEKEDIQDNSQPIIQASKTSNIIERPNYDFIEELSEQQREKIFKIEKENKDNEVKPKTNKLKSILIAILFAIFGIWGIVNIATIDSLNSQISDISAEYDMNLISYLNNLHNLDATNGENMENLFQTIPKDEVPANSIGKESNWFDRFCNFIAGLFGG